MLSYQHSYHAGCFADVVKHLALTHILAYMVQKEKALFYLDTHAGRGLYDLKEKHALKTQESQTGIQALWEIKDQLPPVFSEYIASIAHYNPQGSLRYYPGSVALAMHLLRRQDRLLACELHPQEFEALRQFVGREPRIHCCNENGYSQLHAVLPPPERRGLIMIDPSYEVKMEYRAMTQALKSAYQRFTNGVYCVWYPLVDNKNYEQLVRGMKAIGAEKQLQVEFYLNPPTRQGMQACGLWILNPPFQLEAQLQEVLAVLQKIFHPETSTYHIASIR